MNFKEFTEHVSEKIGQLTPEQVESIRKKIPSNQEEDKSEKDKKWLTLDDYKKIRYDDGYDESSWDEGYDDDDDDDDDDDYNEYDGDSEDFQNGPYKREITKEDVLSVLREYQKSTGELSELTEEETNKIILDYENTRADAELDGYRWDEYVYELIEDEFSDRELKRKNKK